MKKRKGCVTRLRSGERERGEIDKKIYRQNIERGGKGVEKGGE
jgi:hypothetical protein